MDYHNDDKIVYKPHSYCTQDNELTDRMIPPHTYQHTGSLKSRIMTFDEFAHAVINQRTERYS